MILRFELSDLLELGFFFDLQKRLLNGLGEQNVENGLYFSVIIKQVVVFNLGDFVNTRLLRNVARGRRFLIEIIGLALNFLFASLLPALFLQEVSKIDLNTRRRARS